MTFLNSISLSMRNAQYSIRRLLRFFPLMGSLSILLMITVALFPALLVVTVTHLTNALVERSESVFLWSLLVAIIAGSTRGLIDLSMSVGRILINRIKVLYHEELTTGIARLSVSDLRNNKIMNQVQQSRGAIDTHVSGLAESSLNSLKAFITVGSLMIALWALSPMAAIIIALSSIPTILAFLVVARREATFWPQLARVKRKANYFEDQLTYEKTAVDLYALDARDQFAKKAVESYRDYSTKYKDMTLQASSVIFISGLITSGLLWLALIQLISPDLPVSSATAGVVAVMAGMAATSDAGYTFGQVLAAAEPVQVYRTLVASFPAQPEPVHHCGLGDVVHTENVVARYSSSTDDVLRGVSFTARRGELVALVGTNGAGKTTFVNCLSGIQEPSSGSIMIDDRDIVTVQAPDITPYFSILTQEFGRYELTVREALSLGVSRDPSDDELWAALTSVGLESLVHSLPDQLDAQLGSQWDGVGLSGGQWQRLALARIYLRNSPIWILDEPTSAIDAEAEAQIFADLRNGAEERITIVVSHRVWTLKSVDRIYVFDEGRIVEEGTFQELSKAGGRFQELFTEQLTHE